MAKRRSFDEVYPVKDYYRRYDPRNTAFGQARKKTGDYKVGYANGAGKVGRMRKGIPDYSPVDYAFKEAAEVYTGCGFNTGYYSWSPMGVTHKRARAPRSTRDTPRQTAPES